ncbi:MAG: zf-HC2 domain-containing protein [Bryobacterales bacterium]|nr:zf-HC2 domain-containing protein [Bryobacterales bacterium]
MNCSEPFGAAVLGDYWLGVLGGGEEEVLEEHLFGCDECGARLREMIALADGVRNLAKEGCLRMVVSEAFLRRVEEEGLRVRQYTLPAGGEAQCTVTADDDLLIARLAADMSGARRVDLSIRDGDGVERLRLPDIPVRAGASSVVYQESMTFAKAAPDNEMIMRLMALDEAGERLLGEYVFHHTRSLPGPGGW